MKPLVAILFILGIGWTLLAWMVVLSPLGIVMPEYRYQSGDIAFSIIGAFLSIIGYWIWFGWGFYLKTGRYPLTSPLRFWSLSLVIHILWAFAIPFGVIVFVRDDLSSYTRAFVEFWREGQNLPFRSWIGFNIVFAIIAIFNSRLSQTLTNTEVERGCGGQPTTRPEST